MVHRKELVIFHILLLTTYNRLRFLSRCITTIQETVPGDPIFCVNDGSTDDTAEYLLDQDVECVINTRTNVGIAPSINTGLDAIYNWARFQVAEKKLPGVGDARDLWISYVQDDVEFIEKDWANKLYQEWLKAVAEPDPINVAFVTGHDAPEHRGSRKYADSGFDLRMHIRATHMMTRYSRWERGLSISEYGERGLPRGHPGNGIGSDVDWWFMRGPRGVEADNAINLVVPGILRHAGAEHSTWQKNKLPEQE